MAAAREVKITRVLRWCFWETPFNGAMKSFGALFKISNFGCFFFNFIVYKQRAVDEKESQIFLS